MDRFLKAFWGAAILIWSLGSIIAAPPLTITDAGYYLTIVGDDGVPALVLLENVTDMRSGDKPSPPDAKPDFDLELVKQVKEWADAIGDTKTSQSVAMVYSHVRAAGLSEPATWLVLKAATDAAVSITASENDWSPFRTHLSDVITEGRQRGTLQSSSQIQKMLRSVQQGLEMAADGSDALSTDDAVAITAATNEAIDAQK